MLTITLPDGSQRQFDKPVTVLEVAQNIGAGLAKAALAGSVDGVPVDVSYLISNDAAIKIITAKDPLGLEVIRHSAAHLLAQAVKQLFPEAQVTIGPVIENGFFYDFAFDRAFTPDDMAKIEARMVELAKAAQPVSRQTMSRNEAIEFFKGMGENFKAEIIESIPEGETLSLYSQGEFTDLCRGPHVPNTEHLKAFKLMSVAGAYWRGDSKNQMLQRIYGTAFGTDKDLKAHLFQLEEADKRDHRKIAKALDLFHLQEEAPGMVFWHENGWTIWQVIEQYIRQKQKAAGYSEIRTPQVVDVSLWKKSGHAEKYIDNMFLTHSENRDYAIKPMSCPCHVQVYNQGLKSYRDLPVRLAEFGNCHRNESSGSLHGILRVRGMTQDDGHVFCTEDQIQDEISSFMKLALSVYADFGLDQSVRVKIASRPEKRIGADELWDKAEQSLANALEALNIAFEWLPGEGAFYGPKVEMHLRDSIGREWQCGTVQIDFFIPERLEASYVTEDNVRKVPVMIHRAVLGSMERFIGMLIEHYAGDFPAWLAPTQAVVMGISEKHTIYVNEITEKLQKAGFRARSDLRNEKIGFKIREQTLQKVPFLLVAGDQEAEQGTVSVRTRKGKDLGVMPVSDFIAILEKAVASLGKITSEE
ncbi:MAG: threonine--tRNA ligase [Gammaproteobacteria bacterium]|nr:threonine--tRNA ligase [Gammaproteobacteria bacterium]